MSTASAEFGEVPVGERGENGHGRGKANGQAQGDTSLLPGLQRVSDVDPKSVRWLWYPYLPAGQISILDGPGGVGKGLVATTLAAKISKAAMWPTTDIQAPNGIVLWGETEDPLAEVIRPRLDAAEADVNNVFYCKPEKFLQLDIRKLIEDDGLRIIVLSPMVSFLRGLTGLNDELMVRGVLEKLQSDIEGTECAVLGLCHTNKKPDLRAIERLLGSVAFTNFVRAVLLVSRTRTMKGGFGWRMPSTT
jgi:DNA repair protein RadA/Sms